jgi:hypothetical protein
VVVEVVQTVVEVEPVDLELPLDLQLQQAQHLQ